MNIKKFILSIKELSATVEDESHFEINIINDEFNAYHDEIYQMVYCLGTIGFLPGFEQFDDVVDDEPIRYHKMFGYNVNYEYFYAFNYMTDEIVLLDDTQVNIKCKCAKNSKKFLDGLFELAKHEARILNKEPIDESNANANALEAAKLAGGREYYDYWKLMFAPFDPS